MEIKLSKNEASEIVAALRWRANELGHLDKRVADKLSKLADRISAQIN